MTVPLRQGTSGIEGEKLTYAFINENNKEIYTFTANELVTWSISGGEKGLFSIKQDTGKLSFKDVPDYEKIKNLHGTTLEFHTNFSSQSVGAKLFVEVYKDQNQTTPIVTNNFIGYINNVSYNNNLINRLVSLFTL